jgi:hypothetical protein
LSCASSSLYLLASPGAPYLFIETSKSLSLGDAAILFIRPQKSMLYHPTNNKIVSTYHVSILACALVRSTHVWISTHTVKRTTTLLSPFPSFY